MLASTDGALILGTRGQFELYRVEFTREVAELIELLANCDHLITVQSAKRLNDHRNRLLELIQHLLLHLTELIHQRYQQ